MLKKILHYFKNREERLISRVVILAVVFGFAAGVVGQIVADVYIDPWKQEYINMPFRDIEQLNQPIPELRRVTRFLGTQQDIAVNQAVQKIKPALAGVYVKKSANNTAWLQQVYTAKEFLGNGFLLTSDGWLITHLEAISGRKESQLTVVYQQQAYNVDRLVIDELTGVVFLKTSITNASVAILGDSTEVFEGQLAVVMGMMDNVQLSALSSIRHLKLQDAQNFIMSSDQFKEKIALASPLSAEYVAAPVVNLAGEVVGIVTEQDDNLSIVMPISQFRSVITDVLRDRSIVRPKLGISYIDLAYSPGILISRPDNIVAGALVYGQPTTGLSAQKAGLRSNDIIISVDQEYLTAEKSLTYLIQQYKPGDNINLEIYRNGELIKISVILE